MHAVDTLPINRKPQDHKNGHQTILKTFIRDKTLIEIEFTDGTTQRGRVTQFDNYTITIMRVSVEHQSKLRAYKEGHSPRPSNLEPTVTENGHRTYFKSCIKGFGAANV